MQKPIPRPRLIVVCGLPGSGKTTLAKALEPPIERERVSGWLDVFQPPTADEMALFDEPLVAELEHR